MISKILLNGENRYALIFDEVTTGEDIAEMRNALIELVAMASNETNRLPQPQCHQYKRTKHL